MPNKAFLHKKSLIDKFRDDHKKGTGYIQAARARRTWNNPITRRKRTNKLNDWITSFAGKRHIRKLSRFNALKESNMQISDKMLDDVLAYYKTTYNWSDELIDRERADTMEWLQAYADVFVPAYENGGTEDGLMAIADAEEMGVGRAELSMMEAYKDVGDYTDGVLEIVFNDYGADPEKVIKHEDEITRIIGNCHDKNSFIRACAMQIMDYLKSKSEANYDYDLADIKPLHGIAKSRFEGMSLQIEALCYMYADNGGLSDAQVEQLKELRDTIVVFGERAKPYIDWANEVIDGNESSKDEKLGYEKGRNH